MALVAVKTLNGFNYVRIDYVIAVQTSATGGSTLVMTTGTLINSTEPSKDIAARIEALDAAPASPAKDQLAEDRPAMQES